MILREGADKVSVNSAAILNPELVSEAADKFGKPVCGGCYRCQTPERCTRMDYL